MRCIQCNELLDVLPIYNGGKDSDFPPTVPFCGNVECSRYGLLGIVFKTAVEKEEKKDDKSKHKKV